MRKVNFFGKNTGLTSVFNPNKKEEKKYFYTSYSNIIHKKLYIILYNSLKIVKSCFIYELWKKVKKCKVKLNKNIYCHQKIKFMRIIVIITFEKHQKAKDTLPQTFFY